MSITRNRDRFLQIGSFDEALNEYAVNALQLYF